MSGRLPASIAGTTLTYDSVSRALNVTGAVQMVKVGPGRLTTVVVNTLSAAITIFSDVSATGSVAAANLMFTIPASAPVGSVYKVDMPFNNGLAVTPGASGVLALSYL